MLAGNQALKNIFFFVPARLCTVKHIYVKMNTSAYALVMNGLYVLSEPVTNKFRSQQLRQGP